MSILIKNGAIVTSISMEHCSRNLKQRSATVRTATTGLKPRTDSSAVSTGKKSVSGMGNTNTGHRLLLS